MIEKSQISPDQNSAQPPPTWDFDPNTWYYDIYRGRIPHIESRLVVVESGAVTFTPDELIGIGIGTAPLVVLPKGN